MGTEVTVLAPAAHAGEATARARRLFEDWERRLSRFLPGSELSRLNAGAGRPVVVGELLHRVLATALATAVASSCAQAEVAAKVAFVLGRGAGAAFLRGKGLAGLLAGEAGEWWPVGAWSGWTVAAAC